MQKCENIQYICKRCLTLKKGGGMKRKKFPVFAHEEGLRAEMSWGKPTAWDNFFDARPGTIVSFSHSRQKVLQGKKWFPKGPFSKNMESIFF